MIPYFDIALLGVGIVGFVRGARMDRASPLLWGGLSTGAWCVTFLVFGGGILPWMLGQAAAYALLFAARLLRSDVPRE